MFELLALLALILSFVASVYLVATRLKDLESSAELESMVSREAAFLYNNVVLVGNHTVKAARRNGWDRIAVAFVEVDDDRARAIVLVDNKSSDDATNDAADLLALVKAAPDLEAAGFTPDELDALILQVEPPQEDAPDDADVLPEIPDEPITQPGDDNTATAIIVQKGTLPARRSSRLASWRIQRAMEAQSPASDFSVGSPAHSRVMASSVPVWMKDAGIEAAEGSVTNRENVEMAVKNVSAIFHLAGKVIGKGWSCVHMKFAEMKTSQYR